MDGEVINHVFFGCLSSMMCWYKLLSLSKVQWVFSNVLKDNVLQLLVGLSMAPKPNLIWVNAIKALLSGLW